MIVALAPVLMVLLASCEPEPTARAQVWHTDVDAALAVARAQDAAGVIVDVTGTWCAPCQELAAAYETPVMQRALRGWVRVRVDVSRADEAAESFVDRWSAGVPTVLFLDLDGRELERVRTYLPPEKLARRVPRSR